MKRASSQRRADPLEEFQEVRVAARRNTAVREQIAVVSVGRAAVVFGVTPATVRNWISRGYVHARKLPSGHHRIPETEIKRVVSEMVDVGRPVEEGELTHKVRGSMVSPDEDWGPAGP